MVSGLTLPDEQILLDQDTRRTEARNGDPVPGLNFSAAWVGADPAQLRLRRGSGTTSTRLTPEYSLMGKPL